MNILCTLFGHKSREGDFTGGEYMRVVPGAVDGIGREHATLYAKCPRCEKSYRAGAIHIPRTPGVAVTDHQTFSRQTPTGPKDE